MIFILQTDLAFYKIAGWVSDEKGRSSSPTRQSPPTTSTSAQYNHVGEHPGKSTLATLGPRHTSNFEPKYRNITII
jgi:hypothetical protein